MANGPSGLVIQKALEIARENAMKQSKRKSVADRGYSYMPAGAPESMARAVRNTPRSAGQFVEGIWNMVTSPIETAKGLRDVVAGGARNVRNTVSPNPSYRPSKQMAEQDERARGVARYFKDRYGSVESAQRTFEEDPVGFSADLSTALGGGSLVTKGVSKGARAANLNRVANVADQVANALSIASKGTDPLVRAGKVISVVPGVKPAARAAARAIPKGRVVNAKGALTPGALNAIEKSGISADVFDDPALRQRWSEIARAKGITPATAREALLSHVGAPEVTRGMATGERPVRVAREAANEAYQAARQGSAEQLRGAAPSLADTPIGDVVTNAPIGQSFIDSYLSARNNVNAGYRRAYAHPGSFTPEAVDELTPTIERVLKSDAFESLPDNIADFSKSHSFPETSKVLYGSGKVKPLEERFREFTVAPVTDATPPGEVFKSAVNVGGIWFDHVDGGWKSRKTGEILKPNNPLNKSLDEVAGRNTHIVGNLPANGIAPANVGADGRIYVGRPGDTHFDITNQYENAGPWSSDAGFVTPDGRYLDAQQAAEWTAQNPSTLPENALGIREVERIRRDITNAIPRAHGDDRAALKALSTAIDTWTEQQAATPGRFTGEGANVASDMAAARQAYKDLRNTFDRNPNPNIQSATREIRANMEGDNWRGGVMPAGVDQTVQGRLTQGLIGPDLQPGAPRGRRTSGEQTYSALTQAPENGPSLLTDEGRAALDDYLRAQLYRPGMTRADLDPVLGSQYGQLLNPEQQMLLRQHAEANNIISANPARASSLEQRGGTGLALPVTGGATGAGAGDLISDLLGPSPIGIPGVSPHMVGGALGAAAGRKLDDFLGGRRAERQIGLEMAGAPAPSLPHVPGIGSVVAYQGTPTPEEQEQAQATPGTVGPTMSVEQALAQPAPEKAPETDLGPVMSIEEALAQPALEDRPQRASGGRVSDIEPLVSGLMKRAQQAKAYTDNSTKPLLNAHDDAIASALAVAQRAI